MIIQSYGTFHGKVYLSLIPWPTWVTERTELNLVKTNQAVPDEMLDKIYNILSWQSACLDEFSLFEG